MSGEWEKKVLLNGNNMTVEGTLVGSPSTTSSLHSLMRRLPK